MLSSQSPISANETKAPNTISAARQPPKRQTSSAEAAIVPIQVSHSKKSMKAVTSHSHSERKPSSTAKNGFGLSAVRCSSSQFWALSSLRGSSCQVSEVGQSKSPLQQEVGDQPEREDGPHLSGPPPPARRRREGRRSGEPAASYCHPRLSGRSAIACEDRHAVHDAHAAAVLDRANRAVGRGRHRHGVVDLGGHGELGAAGLLAGLGVAHDPAQGEHVGARDVAHEVRHVVVGGRADQLLRRAELHDRAVAHDRDPVAQPQRLGQVVGDEQHRLAGLRLEPDHLVLHVAPDQRVERAEGLVVEHQLGVDRERARQPDALLHAAGQLVGELVGGVLEADQRRASRWRAPGARSWPRPGSPARRRRCRSRAGGRAGRSAGTPSTPCGGAARAAARRRRRITSRPLIVILPAVGSISRISVRTSVDLPEPDSPMTTNTSPGLMSIETSRTATTQPVLRCSSERERSASGEPMILSAPGPKTFQMPSARTSGSPFGAPAGGPSSMVSTAATPSESVTAAMIYQASGRCQG